MCLRTVAWLPTGEATQERIVLDAELRERLLRAVDVLTAKELAVIRSCYWDETPQHEAARIMGTTEAYYSRLKSKAIGKLRAAMSADAIDHVRREYARGGAR
jgi:RNA polymerase sigma factor (sigma-70 family)